MNALRRVCVSKATAPTDQESFFVNINLVIGVEEGVMVCVSLVILLAIISN